MKIILNLFWKKLGTPIPIGIKEDLYIIYIYIRSSLKPMGMGVPTQHITQLKIESTILKTWLLRLAWIIEITRDHQVIHYQEELKCKEYSNSSKSKIYTKWQWN